MKPMRCLRSVITSRQRVVQIGRLLRRYHAGVDEAAAAI